MSDTYDPILLEIMNNEFGALADEMSYVILRTGRSFGAHEGADFMVGILNENGQLIARGQFGVQAWYVQMVIPWVLEKYSGKFQPGDVIITNDPYGGGSHLNDIVLIAPVFWNGKLVAFTGAALHHQDVGGRAAGNMSSRSAEVYEEGVRLPTVMLYSAGVPNTSLFEVLEANSRAGDDLLGDLNAKVIACRRGDEGYVRLIRKYGLETVRAYGEHLIDYTERQMRAGIAALPDGEWAGTVVLDDDGAQGPGPKIVNQVTIQGDSLNIDYTGTSPQVPTAINMPPVYAKTRIVEALRNVLALDIPVNAGMWNVFDTVMPPGSLLNPLFPAAVGARALGGAAQRDLLLATLSAVAPDRVPASDSGPPGILVYTARESGKAPQILFDLYQNGTGGRANGDGVDGGGANYSARGMMAIPVEAIERECPVRVEGFEFAPDTGGPGKFRGAVSIYRSWRFLQDGIVHIRNYHFEKVAYGVAGGSHGTKSRVILESDGNTVELTGEAHIEIPVKSGNLLTHIFAGAGGHGDPRERDRARIRDDVLDEKITIAQAERAYGVVIDPTSLQVDETATIRLRENAEWTGTPTGEPSVGAIEHRTNVPKTSL